MAGHEVKGRMKAQLETMKNNISKTFSSQFHNFPCRVASSCWVIIERRTLVDMLSTISGFTLRLGPGKSQMSGSIDIWHKHYTLLCFLFRNRKTFATPSRKNPCATPYSPTAIPPSPPQLSRSLSAADFSASVFPNMPHSALQRHTLLFSPGCCCFPVL